MRVKLKLFLAIIPAVVGSVILVYYFVGSWRLLGEEEAIKIAIKRVTHPWPLTELGASGLMIDGSRTQLENIISGQMKLRDLEKHQIFGNHPVFGDQANKDLLFKERLNIGIFIDAEMPVWVVAMKGSWKYLVPPKREATPLPPFLDPRVGGTVGLSPKKSSDMDLLAETSPDYRGTYNYRLIIINAKTGAIWFDYWGD